MEIASLGLAIDSTQVKRATVDLDQLAMAGGRAEEAGRRTSVTYANFSKDMSRLVRQVEEMTASQARQERMLAQLNGSFLSTAGAITRATGATTAHAQAAMAAADALGLESRAATSAEKSALAHARAADAEAAASRAIQGASASAASALGAQSKASSIAGEALRSITATGVSLYLGSSVVRAANEATKALYEASAAGQRIRTTLDYASGGNGAKEFDYISTQAQKLGLRLNDTAQAYASFAAAARGTTLEGESARRVFESVAKASAVMGLSSEQTSGTLLALQQMLSKGSVQAEELRGQLGERLSGSFQIAARAMGVTTGELSKMLELGLVPASEFLPKFAAQLEKELGGAAEKAADRLDASVNRLDNSWEKLKRNAGDSGFSKAVSEQYNVLSDGLNSVSEAMALGKARGEGFTGQLLRGAGATLEFLNPLNALSYSAQTNAEKLKEAENKLRELQERGASNSPNIWLRSQYWDTDKWVNKLREARDLLAGAQGGGPTGTGGGRGSVNPQTVGQMNAAQEEWDGKVKKYLNEDSRQSKPQIRAEEIEKAEELNKKLVKEAKARGDVAAAARLEAALKVELGNINEKTKDKTPGAAAALNDGLNSQVQAFRNADKAILDDRKDFEAAMALQVQLGQKGQLDAILEGAAKEEGTWTRRKANFDAELAAAGKKKNSLGEVQRITGQLQDAERDHAQAAAKFAADEAIYNAKNLDLLGQQAAAAGTSARAALEQVRVAGLEGKQIGATGAALGALRQARVEDAAAQLEAKARTQDGLDLSGETSKALRTQAQAVRDLAKANGANESAAMVYEYSRAIKEANELVQFELSLSGESQRDRQIAIAQYQVAVDLKKRLADIDAKNPADSAMAAQLKSDAEAAAAQAKATAAARVQIDEWNRAVDQYDDIFRKGFAIMVNSGQDTWRSFTRSLVTTFKTTVADAIYKMFAQRFVVNMVGNVLGLVGLGGSGAATAAAGSGIGSLLNYGSTAYQAFTGQGVTGQAIQAIGSYLGIGAGAASAGTGLAAVSSGYGIAAGAGTGLGLSTGASGLGLSAGTAATSFGSGITAGSSVAAGGAGAAGIGSAIMAAAPYLAAAALVGNALGLFRSKKVTDTGISGSIGYGASDINTYTETRKGGTLFSGPKYSTATQALDATQAKGIQTATDAIYGSAIAYGKALGLSTEAAQGYTKALDFSTKDLTDAQIQEKLNGLFSDLSNELANRLSGGISENFGKTGETSTQTLARLVTSLQGVNGMLDGLDRALIVTSMGGAVAASALVDAFGGLDAMQERTSSFLQAYYSEAERSAITTRQLTTALQGLGIDALPASREAFRALVEQQDLYTDSGRATYAALLGMSDAFASITPEAQAAAQAIGTTAAELAKIGRSQDIQILELLGDAAGALAARRADELAGMDPLLRAKQDYIYSLQDEKTAAEAAKAAIQTARQSSLDAVKRSLDTERNAVNAGYQATFDTLSASVSKLTGLSGKLRSTLDSMSLAGTEAAQRAAAQAQIQSDLQRARAGGAGDIDQDRLALALATAAKDASGQFSTYEDYALDYAKTANAISELSGITDAAKSFEEQQLAVLKANHDADLARLDGILLASQAFVDAANGVLHNDLLTVTEAIRALGGVLGKGTAGVANPDASIERLYQSLLGRASDAGGAAYFKTSMALGASEQEIAQQIMNSDEYRNRVYSAPAIVSSGATSSNASLEALVSQLIAKTTEQSAELREIRLRTTQTAETLSDAARGTQPLMTTA